MLIRLLPLLSLLCGSLACSLHIRGDETGNSSLSLGPDTPADPATAGYFLNHVALNVNNLTASLDFYTKIFGFRLIFTYSLTEHISFSYIAHSSGGKNGSAYQTTEELLRNKNNGQGLIEMIYIKNTKGNATESIKRKGTMNHVGIIVPDLKASQARLEEYGVEIYKKTGEPMPNEGPLNDPSRWGDASSLNPGEFEIFKEAMNKLNLPTIFAADPDGNLLEILALDDGSSFGTS